jgi:hypothetical protein
MFVQSEPWPRAYTTAAARESPAIIARPLSRLAPRRFEGRVGAAGRLYTSGRSRSRKNALRRSIPPVAPGLPGVPYRYASSRPCSCKRSTRAWANSEHDGIGRTSFGARWLQASLHPVIAESTLVRLAVECRDIDDVKRTGGDTIPTTVADVLLHDDGVELGVEQGSGGACLDAGGVAAVLANVAHHQPTALKRSLLVAAHGRLLDEGDVTPGSGRKIARIIVAMAAQF